MVRHAQLTPLSAVLRRVDAVADGAAPTDGIPTGFPSLDRLMGGGLRAGDLCVIGGDVGSGKSALALAVAMRAAQGGHAALFCTTEATAERVTERMLAIEGRVKMDELRQGALDEVSRSEVGGVVLRLREQGPVVARLGRDPLEALDALLGDASSLGPSRLVVVDAITGILGDARPHADELASAVRRLKALAVEHGAAVLATSHLATHLRDRNDPRPQLDDFGGLGAVKHHADVVLGLFREEMYHADPGVDGATELLILKNRDGTTGYVDLYFYKQWMRFEDMLDPDR